MKRRALAAMSNSHEIPSTQQQSQSHALTGFVAGKINRIGLSLPGAAFGVSHGRQLWGKHMIKPQPWWRTTNRTILVVTLLLCVAAAVGGAYLLGLLDQLGLLH
jgi:hypothetical protein